MGKLRLFNWKFALVLLVFGSLSWSCNPSMLDPESGVEVPYGVSEAGDGMELVDLPLTIGFGEESWTKGSRNENAESCGSGALVLCYISYGPVETFFGAKYFSQAEIEAGGLTMTVPRAGCNFYLVGNMNYINKATGEAVNIYDAMGEDADAFFSSSSIHDFVYRFDGGDAGTWGGVAYRRETVWEIATFGVGTEWETIGRGIPYVQVSKNVDVSSQYASGGGIPNFNACRRLFAKVNVTVDHTAFDGNDPSRVSQFVNSAIYVFRSNCKFLPFDNYYGQSQSVPKFKAESADDIFDNTNGRSGASVDFDGGMSNAHAGTWTFYVPENMQGDLLSWNAGGNPGYKNASKVEAAAPGYSGLCSYIEFYGSLNGAGGYTGNAQYRFYLGANNTSNFDVEGGKEYNVTLGFRASSVFGSGLVEGEGWKVTVGSVTNGHHFDVLMSQTYTGSNSLGSTPVVVRPGRDNSVYLFGNTSWYSADNQLIGRDLVDEGWVPSSIDDIRVSVSGPNLGDYGLWCEYDKTTGRLRFYKYNDNFNAHKGESIPITVKLWPIGAQITFYVIPWDDIVVNYPSGGLWLGTRSTASISGYYGSNVDFNGESLGGNWNSDPVLGQRTAVGTYTGGDISVYGTYPGTTCINFWASNGDTYNNDPVRCEFNVVAPVLAAVASSVTLPFDGEEQHVGVGYYTDSSLSTYFPVGWFDGNCWNNFMRPAISCTTNSGWVDCIGADFSSGDMYLVKTSNSLGNIEDQDFRINTVYLREQGMSLGWVTVYNPALQGLYPNSSSGCRISGKVVKPVLGNIRAYTDTGLSSLNSDGRFDVGYYYEKTSWVGDAPHDQLTDNFSFGVAVPYVYPGGNILPTNPSISWQRSGAAKTWTSTNGETFGPVISYELAANDTGSGGTVLWKYDEASQVMQNSAGEPVPGGLLVPYGPQTITLTVQNKWDHRSYSQSKVFEPVYDVVSCSYFAVARIGQTTADVYPLPRKVIKYLYSMGNYLTRAQRSEMILLFDQGTNYMGRVDYENLYRLHSYEGGYFLSGYTSYFPLHNLEARYVCQYVNENQSVTVWSQGVVDWFKSCAYNQVRDELRLVTIEHTREVRIHTGGGGSGNPTGGNQGVLNTTGGDYF